MKWKPGLTVYKTAFLICGLAAWWATGRYASTGRAVVRTLAAEADAKLDTRGAASAANRMKALHAAGNSAGGIAAVVAEWGAIKDVVELRRLFESCASLAEPWRILARQEAVRRWVDLDAKSAASYAVAHRDQEFLKAFMAHWGIGLSAGELAASIKEIFGDPRNFVALIPDGGDDFNYQISVEDTKRVLGGMDPFAAAQAWAQLGYAKLPPDSVFALFQSSAAKDPVGAAALAATIPDERLRTVATDAVLSGLALADPLKALSQAPADASLRMRIFMNAFSKLAETDPQQAVNFIETLTGEEDRLLAPLLLCRAWIKHDPAQAAKYAQEHSTPQLRSLLAQHLSYQVEQQGAKAPEWAIISELTDPTMRIQLSGTALSQALADSPAKFQEEWDTLTPLQQAESLAGLAGRIPGVNPLQANWTDLAPKVLALQGAALEQALQGDALGAAWAQQDPVSLLAALNRHPHSVDAEKATLAAVREWAAQDLVAATSYVDQIPAGPRRHAARASLTDAVIDPSARPSD